MAETTKLEPKEYHCPCNHEREPSAAFLSRDYDGQWWLECVDCSALTPLAELINDAAAEEG